MKYKPNCIKCRKQYDSDEPDDYYCEPCHAEKVEIAKQIDAKRAGMVRKPVMSDLQRFDAIAKERGSKFINIRDMGITL